jgi:hypothetical protein
MTIESFKIDLSVVREASDVENLNDGYISIKHNKF